MLGFIQRCNNRKTVIPLFLSHHRSTLHSIFVSSLHWDGPSRVFTSEVDPAAYQSISKPSSGMSNGFRLSKYRWTFFSFSSGGNRFIISQTSRMWAIYFSLSLTGTLIHGLRSCCPYYISHQSRWSIDNQDSVSATTYQCFSFSSLSQLQFL